MIRDQALLCDPAQKRVLELRNQQEVFRYITDFHNRFEGRDPFAIGVLEELHRLTVAEIYPCAGGIRRHETDRVAIVATFTPATPAEVLLRLPELATRAQNWRDGAKHEEAQALGAKTAIGPFDNTTAARIAYATELFYEFLIVHPFRGGNGRVSRAFLHLLLYNMDILAPPTHIFDYIERRRGLYFHVLGNADAGNIIPLVKYIQQGVLEAVLAPAMNRIADSPVINNCLDGDLRKFLIARNRDALSIDSYVRRLMRLERKLDQLQKRLQVESR